MSEVSKIHMIGIGGIGMSALARLYLHEGKAVTGSDAAISPITCGLETLGITFTHGHGEANVPEDADLVVYSDAVREDNPERVRARELGIPEQQYFKALASVANRYYLIAVAGTHGKTTTTAMLTDILEDAGLDPTVIVGSLRTKTGSNFRPGKSKYCIVEADEYRNHFRHLRPDVLIITNIEHDHVDHFASLAKVQTAFAGIAKRVPEEGAVVTAPTDQNIAPVLDAVKAEVIDYTKRLDITMQLRQPGLHNRMNAAAAVAAAAFLGITPEDAKGTLAAFSGTWRRFEYKGALNGAPVYDDYAHHPTEIAATITAARDLYPDKRLILIFQPHTYSRTSELMDAFAESLAKADRLILAPIYAAREENVANVSSEMLVEKVHAMNPHAECIEVLDDITTAVKETASPDDVILVLGAGDITTVANALVAER